MAHFAIEEWRKEVKEECKKKLFRLEHGLDSLIEVTKNGDLAKEVSNSVIGGGPSYIRKPCRTPLQCCATALPNAMLVVPCIKI